MPEDDIHTSHSALTLVYPFAQSSGGVLPSSPDITDLSFSLSARRAHTPSPGCPCSQQDSFMHDALAGAFVGAVISLNDVVPLAASFRSPPIRSSPTYPDDEVIDFRRRLPLPLSPFAPPPPPRFLRQCHVSLRLRELQQPRLRRRRRRPSYCHRRCSSLGLPIRSE